MSLAGIPVLVTGAGGFVGSHLAERLVHDGARVRALVHYNGAGSCGWLDRSPAREDVEIVAGDVRDPEGLRAAVKGVQVVFHLAALIAIPYSYRAPRSYVQTNVEGTLNVLQAALDGGLRRVVVTSTSEVYGSACYTPMDEQHPLRAQSPYAASKIGADKLAEAFHCAYGLPVVVVRPFNAFGPRQSARAIVPTIVTQALTRPTIRLGNLEPTRDLTFVVDTVDAFARAAEAAGAVGRVVNVGTGRETSVGDLARTIARLVGRDVPIEQDAARVRPAGSEVSRLCADARQAQAVLGWRPDTPLEDGLARTIAWIEENLDQFRPAEYGV